MTLPKDVQDAMDAADNDCGLELTYLTRDEWHSIRDHLLSQDAQIVQLARKNNLLLIAANDHQDRAELAESRLAAADTLLREIDRNGVLSQGVRARITDYLQGAGDEA